MSEENEVEMIRRIANEEVRKAVEPLSAQLVRTEAKLEALIELIKSAGGKPVQDETGEFDILWGDKQWIDEERSKSLDRRKGSGRKF